MSLILHAFLVVVFLSFSVFNSLSAQELNKTKVDVENKASSEKKILGEIAFVIFYPGSQPAQNYPITDANNNKFFTNEDGMIFIDLPEGRHEFNIKDNNQSFSVKVVGGESSQVIINLIKDKTPLLDVEVAKESRFKEKTVVAGAPVRVSGQVVDGDSGKPIAGAKIYLSGIEGEIITDKSGRYETNVPEGEYVVSLIHPKYGSKVLDDMSADKDHTDFKKLSLVATGLELEEFVVLAPNVKGSVAAFIELRKNSSNVTDVIGAEELAKTGDSDAGSGLKRVTGVSLVDGKYVYVRGLGERYSNTLMNGSMLASPEVSRRVVPLDMFPTKFLEGMVVQKSYSPDMPAEFGGGVIQLNSKSIPNKFTAKVSLSWDASDNNKNGRMISKGGDYDSLGFDDGNRELPKSLVNATRNRPLFEDNGINDGFTLNQLSQFGRDFSNHYSVQEGSQTNVPNLGLSFGRSFNFSKVKIGGMFSGLYKNTWDVKSDQLRVKFGSDSQSNSAVTEKFIVNQSENTINLGGTGEMSFSYGKNNIINYTTILSRKTDNGVEIRDGQADGGDRFLKTDLYWIEREMEVNQFRGQHKIPFLGQLQIDWRASAVSANHYEPDHRELVQERTEDGRLKLDPRPLSNRRSFVNLDDKTNDIGVDLTLPIQFSKKARLKFKTGYYGLKRERSSDTRRFSFLDKRSDQNKLDNPELTLQEPEVIFNNKNRVADGFVLVESTMPTDTYRAEQNINAFYAMADAELGDFLFSGGYRNEETEQSVVTGGTLYSRDPTQLWSSLNSQNLLPAFSLRYKISNKHQIRASYSETISRPDFRESSPAEYRDYDTGDTFIGNTSLDITTIENFDLRYEFYMSPKESFSIGAFYKKFNNPIEVISISGGDRFTFMNAESAENYGLELEYRQMMWFMPKFFGAFTFVSNLALIESEVNLGKDIVLMTNKERPLQGQSPYLANAQFQWESRFGLETNIIYNVFGERISSAGIEGRDDEYEEPFHQLDFLVRYKNKEWGDVSLKVKNILDEEVIRTEGGKTKTSYERGVDVFLGYSKTF